MKLNSQTLKRAVFICATTLALAHNACAQSPMTSFVLPFATTQPSPTNLIGECALYAGGQLMSHGMATTPVGAGTQRGQITVPMHWPHNGNPARIDRFACRVVTQAGLSRHPAVVDGRDPGVFELPHAQPHLVWGRWPQ
ncbi:MAG: hypothetical protein ACRDAM_21360 [Casimicrobium sp.]